MYPTIVGHAYSTPTARPTSRQLRLRLLRRMVTRLLLDGSAVDAQRAVRLLAAAL